MKEILRTLVGSRAHGTFTEESDYDYRGVFMVDTEDFISPFREIKQNSWLEGKNDDTSYELSHFCKMCAQGNPSALELLVAEPISMTKEGEALRLLLPDFLSKKRVYDAFRGYSRNQETKFRDNHMERRWKYAEAQVRTLYQLYNLLMTGVLKIKWSDGVLEELKAIKRGLKSMESIYGRIGELEELCSMAYEKSSLPEKPNIEKIETFLFDTYLHKNEVPQNRDNV